MAQYQRAVEPGVSDLVLLTTLNEKSIMENVKQRLKQESIYTYISNVLIICNPFKRIPLYTEAMINLYRTRNRNELPPHVFALAEDTYRSMVQEEENHCIIISGESGAGKTEASKQVVQYIAAVSGNSPEMQKVKRVMLESNPLLEISVI
jgi:myosin-1